MEGSGTHPERGGIVTKSIQLDGARVIAAMTPPTSKSAFNRGRLVLRASDGTIIRVRTYTNDGRAEGPTYSEEDLQELLEAGQITDLSKAGSIPATSGASLWVLRRNYPRRDRALSDLTMSGLLLHQVVADEEDARLCIVAEGRPDGAAMLDRWRDAFMNAAKEHADRGDWDHARLDAEVAQAVCRGLDADVLALLSLAYAKCGREKRASGILVMARRSRGPEFEARVVRVRTHFERTLTLHKPERVKPRHDLAAALQRFPMAVQDLGKPRSSRLAA